MGLTVDPQLQQLQQAAAAHNAGNLQEAVRLYRGVLRIQPNHPEANHNLGLIAVSMNQPDVALPLFKSAIDANPNVEFFWLSYIDALIAGRQFADAKQALKKSKKKGVGKEKIKTLMQKLVSVKAGKIPTLVPPRAELQKLIDHYQSERYEDAEELGLSITKQFPEHPSSYNVLGGIYKQTGRLSELAIVTKKVVALSPKDPEAHSNLGLALKELGRLEESELSYKRALELKPDFVQVHKGLGNVLSELGKLLEAEESYKQAVSLKHDDAELHNNLGNTLLELGRLEEAEVSCRKAIALKPDYAEALNNLGGTLQKLGRLDEAEVSFSQAMALKPDFALAQNNLGGILQEMGRFEEAEASYRQAMALRPDYAEAHSNLGSMLKMLGRLEEAEISYRQAIAFEPNLAEVYCNLGVTLKEMGRLEEAEANYRQAIVLKSDFTESYSNLGNALKEQGRLEEAEVSYRQAMALSPDYAEAHSNLGGMLKEQGRLEEAEASYRTAIELKPDFAQVRHLLASLIGETTNSPPRVYVENLFDGYASKFENSLVDTLQYKMPKMIVEMILKNHPGGTLGSILDLGCGTGLTGVEIKDYCTKLEGFDLSNRMLDEARKKNAYDRLTHRDIVDYLSTENLNFDYFISTDVFIYVGDLSDICELIKSRNRSGGKLAFSTEHTDKNEFFLEKSGRYSHSKTYIEGLCENFDYKLSHFEIVKLRKEKSVFLNGGLYLLDF